MTLKEAIGFADEVKPNAFSTTVKVKWLEQCDGHLAAELLRMNPVDLDNLRYSADDLSTELLFGAPYEDIYPAWLMAQIDLNNGEANRYQNSMQVYNALYGGLARWLAEHYELEKGVHGLDPWSL